MNHDPTKVKAPSYPIGIPYKSKSSTMRFSLFTIIIIVPFCATLSKVIAWHISDLFGGIPDLIYIRDTDKLAN